MHVNIRGMHKNLSGLSLPARGGDVVSCSETLVSSRHHISKLMVLDFGRCCCSKVRLIGSESWLYTCVMALRYIDIQVMNEDVVKL